MNIAFNTLKFKVEEYLIYTDNKDLVKNENFSKLYEQSSNFFSTSTDEMYARGMHPLIERIKSTYSKSELEKKLETDGYFTFS